MSATEHPGIRRGDVWWADLPAAAGSAPVFRRPVVVVSADGFNTSTIRTVTVAVLTSNARLASAPGNVQVVAGDAGLPRDSVVNVSQVVTADRTALTDYLGRLRPRTMAQVDAGLRLALDL